MPRAPAIPTWRSASGRCVVSAVTVARRSLDRADAARERHHTGAGAGELPCSGRDDEDHQATVAVSPGWVNGCKDRRAPASSDGAARSPVPQKGDFFEAPARSGHLRHLKVKAPIASRP